MRWTNITEDDYLPEIRHLPEDLQHRLRTESHEYTVMTVKYWLAAATLVFTTCCALILAHNLLSGFDMFTWLFLFIVIALPLGMWVGRVRRRSRRAWLAIELLDMKLRPLQCLMCNYDLRGTPDEATSCPECGAAIAPVTSTSQN